MNISLLDVKKIEKRLVQLEKDHQLADMLESLLMICKRVKINYTLDNCMIPYIRKYFSTIPSTRAKSIADELIAVCNEEFSLWYAFLTFYEQLESFLDVSEIT